MGRILYPVFRRWHKNVFNRADNLTSLLFPASLQAELSSVFCWRKSGMCFYVFAEEGKIREIKFIGDLLNRFLRVFHESCDVFHGQLVNQFESCFSAYFFTYGG